METQNNQSTWLDLNEACRIYPLSRRTFFKLIEEGKVSAYKPLKRKTLLNRDEIEQFIMAARSQK